jgi:threonine dehydratase
MAVTLTLDLIADASRFLRGRVRHTPLEPSPKLSELLGVPVWLKLECLQTTGSFKLRGALFRLSRLSEEEKRAGVFTCSAGNHGKGVAYAAKALGITPTIVVPSSIDGSKYRAMVAMGAKVICSRFPGYDETEAWAMEEAAKSGKTWISAFDEDAIMAGNGGSLAAEILEDLPEAQSFVVPVGGGGLAAGLSFLVKAKRQDATVVGCNHELSPALALSLKQGYAATRLPAATTTAGGLEGGIGERAFEVVRSRVDRVALLSEAELFEAVRWTFDAHQYVVETAAAAPVAACLHGKTGEPKGPTVLVLSGRNVSIDTLTLILG